MNEYDKMLRRLYLATNRIDGGYYFFARGAEVKENVLALLYALDDGQPHTQAEIARDWQIPKTTVNTNIKELKAAGYVAFLPSQAGRERVMSRLPSCSAASLEAATLAGMPTASWWG